MNATLERVLAKGLGFHQWLYERSDGRVGSNLGGRPMLLLRTVGRKTGQPRTAALLCAPDGDRYIVIAFSGRGPHPGWFHNLLANPDIEIQFGRRRISVRAHVATGEERTRCWNRVDEVSKGQYRRHQANTAREIPVVLLEPR